MLPSLCLATGKRQSRLSAINGATGKKLFYLQDLRSNFLFLVDTGAEVSVFPPTRLERRHKTSGPLLTAANGSIIRTYGTKRLSLVFPSGKYGWEFTLADVSQPLLGADFLRAQDLLVDVKHRRLIHLHSLTSVPLRISEHVSLGLNYVSTGRSCYAQILAEFPEIITPHFTHVRTTQAQREASHLNNRTAYSSTCKAIGP